MRAEKKVIVVRLAALEGDGALSPRPGDRLMEFHLSRAARSELRLGDSLFSTTGNLIVPDFASARGLARRINERIDAALLPDRAVRAGRLNAMALIDEILHSVARLYREKVSPEAFSSALAAVEGEIGKQELDRLLEAFTRDFPPLSVYQGKESEGDWLAAERGGLPNRELAIEELLLLRLANENPAFEPYRFLFDDGSRPLGFPEDSPFSGSLAGKSGYGAAMAAIERHFAALPRFGPDDEDLVSMLRAPMRAAPYSLPGQLDYIRRRWGLLLGDFLLRLLGGIDLIAEEEKPRFPGPGPTRAYVYKGLEAEYERFSPDRDWMPNVVMMAKSSLVWLDQLSKAYGRMIRTLDAIPDEELDSLASRGFNALWLIGIWERSQASAEIKRRCGNPEAAASAYSLFDYEIASELGGWAALENLKGRCAQRGIRLAADMVPNHTGIDSAWMRQRPELFMGSGVCPYPNYSFNGGDLSGDPRVGLWIEDHYYDRKDAAVVFKRLDRATGRVDYLYHGNDGTGMPWNDTAQIDFLKPEAREAVEERILHVARNFPIIRFDAAMVLARKSFRRLWYPAPGSGGDIPSRAEHAMSDEAFAAAMPAEFWREVVDRCAREAPDTLLLAEAFWMMEGYFVRTLGMHRVYNSAFMNMLKKEENRKYRETIKNTIEFDKDILKRFVNFMNNPDEDTAVAQFGSGDKYFGVCTMMATMPGLPMFGHGQLEGFTEKYGMEYRRAYRDEKADRGLLERHEAEIFPLLKRRRLFSGVEDFLLYDLVGADGGVNENVFAYTNGSGGEKALVVYNNAYTRAEGRIKLSAPYAEKLPGGAKRTMRRALVDALGLCPEEGHFAVMREQRSGLWFIRSSREIDEAGLALILDGFQCQVFLDIFEAVDDERRLYSAVHEALGGKGAPDLADAIQDVVLKDLYAALSGLANPAYFAELRGLLSLAAASPERAKAGKALLARAKAPALAFYATVQGLIKESAAEEGMPGGAEGSGAAEKAAARFEAGLRALLELPELAQAGDFLLKRLLKPGSAETLGAFLVLDGLKGLVGKAAAGEEARRLSERLCLGRKLREALRAAAVPGDIAYRGIALAEAALELGETARKAADRARKSGESGVVAAWRRLEADEEIKSVIGANLFEGVEWFNKERFEEAADFACLAAAVLISTAKKAPTREERREAALRAAGLAETLLKAEALSHYRLDCLDAALAELEGPASRPAAGTGDKAKPAGAARPKASEAKLAAKAQAAKGKKR